MKLFICYCTVDTPLVSDVCKRLRDKGYTLLLDSENQISGEDYALQITEQIGSADRILLFWSNDTANSAWVRREIEFAQAKHKSIVPILLPGADVNGWLQSSFGHAKFAVINRLQLDESVEKLTDLIDGRTQRVKTRDDYNHENESYQSYRSCPPAGGGGGGWISGGCCLIELLILILLGGGIYWLFFTPDEKEEESSTSIKIETDSIKNGSLPSITPNETEQAEKNIPAEDNFNWWYLAVAFTAGGASALLYTKRKEKECNLKVSSDTNSKILIDGELKHEIKAREVYRTHLRKGEYLVDVQNAEEHDRHRTFQHKVDSQESKLLYAEFEKERPVAGKTIKCFIAGSKALQRERDALRAVISMMYNKWENKQFRIQAYTFEDFERTVVVGGQQQKYNDFITQEANWVLLVINGQVGSITLEEFRKAMDAHKLKGSPQILILAQRGSEQDEKVAFIKKEIDREKQYWNDYKDIEEMKLFFESTLNWDLIDMFHKEIKK